MALADAFARPLCSTKYHITLKDLSEFNLQIIIEPYECAMPIQFIINKGKAFGQIAGITIVISDTFTSTSQRGLKVHAGIVAIKKQNTKPIHKQSI